MYPEVPEAEQCTNCRSKATHKHLSVTGMFFPKCEKHMNEALLQDERYNSLAWYSGRNDAGEFYDEDSY